MCSEAQDFSGEFKTKIAFEAIHDIQMVNVVARNLRRIPRRLICERKNYKFRHPVFKVLDQLVEMRK